MGCDSVKSNASEIDAENRQLCYETHKKAFGEWLEGKPISYKEENGIMCVKYESGKSWHYRRVAKESIETEYYFQPCLEWW